LVKRNVSTCGKTLAHSIVRVSIPHGEKILPQDVMIISPYKDQMKLVNKVFNGYKVGYRDNLTADSSQGQEAELVIFLMTKPSDDNGNRPGFLVDRQRLSEPRTTSRGDHREP
jgi:AAA domain